MSALAGFEARRLLTHPAMLLAVLLLPFVLASSGGDDFASYKLLVGAGFLPAAMACLLGSWAAASRARRNSTEDLLGSLPMTQRDRIEAHLLALTAPVASAWLLLGLAVVALRPWRGLATPVLPTGLGSRGVDTVAPSWFALAQGPMLVLAAGVLGVAFGRSRIPAALVGVAVGTGLFASIPVFWWNWGWERFMLPVAIWSHPVRSRSATGASWW